MARTHGTKELWLAAIRADGTRFREAAGTAGALRAPVPPCPGWTVEDLVRHLGGTYAWIGSHVIRGTTSPPGRPSRADMPADDQALAWWDDRYAALLTLLDRLDPQMPAWNWAPQPKVAIFWHRRAAHETAVHRWDVQMAIGRAEPVDHALAADGVTEVLDTWLPGGRRRGATDRAGVVQLGATDVSQEWYVRLRADGGVALLDTETLLDTAEPNPRVHARGTASDLLLALYGRVPFDVLDVVGDEALLDSLRTG